MLFAIGMIGVWITTENWWAMFWTMVASVHLTYSRKKKSQTKEEKE